MGKVKQTIVSFVPSPSPDVMGYKIYIEQVPNPVSYDSKSYDIGNNTSIDISTLPDMTTTDGIYNIGITAYDDSNNESSMSIMENVSLDFLAPDAPGGITITRI